MLAIKPCFGKVINFYIDNFYLIGFEPRILFLGERNHNNDKKLGTVRLFKDFSSQKLVRQKVN